MQDILCYKNYRGRKRSVMQIERINVLQGDVKEQTQQVRTYLFKLAEQLEDALTHIEDQIAAINKNLEQKGE